jgi:predicted DNA-binding mobile mystery protein A
MDKYAKLQIRQLDEALEPFQQLKTSPPPREGWIKAIRVSLGMSLRQLSQRTGLSKTSVASIESLEGKGTAQLDSIRRLANSMDCELVYALVPRHSLQKTVEKQARLKAADLVDRVSTSMELEEQGISPADRARQVQELTEEILRTRKRGLWDV